MRVAAIVGLALLMAGCTRSVPTKPDVDNTPPTGLSINGHASVGVAKKF